MKILIILVSATLLLGCTQREKSASAEISGPETSQADAPALDHGQKWAVNSEMKPYVENGRQLVNEYPTDGSGDHAALAAKLMEQNELLIKSCTMKGESHDQLHKWLHPHLELTKELETASATEAGEIVQSLRESYALYGQYFE